MSSSSWDTPNPQALRLDVFRRHVNRKYGLSLQTYAQLHQWSVTELEAFSIEMWEFLGVVASESPSKPANRLDVLWPRPEWFPDSRINYTKNLLAVGLATHPDAIAVSAGREGVEGPAAWRHVTWRQLQMQVALYATAFRKAGIFPGDRIAAVSSNSLEAVLLLLAAGAVGAIFSSTAPDMGAAGIVERYSQIRPKLLFVDCAVSYGGKEIDLGGKMREVTQTIKAKDSELQNIIVMSGDVWGDPMVTTLSSFINVTPEPPKYVQVPFDYPIYILYTSGTTGPPKCICHAGGGVLLQGKKDFILHFNMGPESTFYQYTTTGWMMWNYLVGALSVGARIVLYDGSPLYPTPTHQVQLLREQGVTHWGTSPKFLSALRKAGFGDANDLDDLECVISAGSALSKDLCTWFEKRFPGRVGLSNGSGGTDCMSGIVGCNPLSTIHYGEIASANLGLDVQVWDANGKNIDNTGQGGELVITKPFFSMPITFWGHDGMEKYRKAYFDVFPGIWCHGDFVRKNPATGGFVMLGRSDGVLNPGGIRFGAAELYGVVEGFPEVLDCIACGQRRPGDADERVLLFLKMRNGSNLDETVRSRVRNAIRKQLSARHVPSHILEVADIPSTLNGKRIEHVVSDVVNGRKPRALGSSIANPECLKEYEKYADLDKRITVSKL